MAHFIGSGGAAGLGYISSRSTTLTTDGFNVNSSIHTKQNATITFNV